MQTVANAFGVRAPVGAHCSTPVPPRSSPSIQLAVPRLSLSAAGTALLASSALLLAPLSASAVDLSFNTSVKASLEARDEAMDFKCKGGMFDCTGDRRDFAKEQYKNFVARMEAKEKGLPVPPPLMSSTKGVEASADAANAAAPSPAQ